MEIELSKKERAKAIYDTGQRTANAMIRGAQVSERTAYRYLAEFKTGGGVERKKYKTRANTKRTSKLVKKVMRKAKDRRRIWSTRAIGSSCGISHITARKTMIERGFFIRVPVDS